MQTKIVATHRGCTIVGVVNANGEAGPPYSVFREGLKIADGFVTPDDATDWIDIDIQNPAPDDEDEDDNPPSPSPF